MTEYYLVEVLCCEAISHVTWLPWWRVRGISAGGKVDQLKRGEWIAEKRGSKACYDIETHIIYNMRFTLSFRISDLLHIRVASVLLVGVSGHILGVVVVCALLCGIAYIC